MKRYRVFIIQEAEDDLHDIHAYISADDSAEKADHVLAQLETLCGSLTTVPFRGHVCPELETIGITSYREVHFKPYRVIYEVSGKAVYVHAMLDGRRDLPSLLERRFTRLSGK